jgi:hypothetical protein
MFPRAEKPYAISVDCIDSAPAAGPHSNRQALLRETYVDFLPRRIDDVLLLTMAMH